MQSNRGAGREKKEKGDVQEKERREQLRDGCSDEEGEKKKEGERKLMDK